MVYVLFDISSHITAPKSSIDNHPKFLLTLAAKRTDKNPIVCMFLNSMKDLQNCVPSKTLLLTLLIYSNEHQICLLIVIAKALQHSRILSV